MTYLLVLAATAILPVLAIVLLRVNGAIAFMSLCVGSVLVTYVSGDINDIFTSFAAKGTLSANQWVQLGLLVVPFVLAILFTRGSVSGAKRITNVLPALAAGMLFALLLVPLLSANVQRHIKRLYAWHQLNAMQTAVILGGAAFSLIFLLLTHRKGGDEGKKSGKH